MNLPVHPSWQAPLAEVEPAIHAMGDFLRSEPAYLPAGKDILRAFSTPFEDVRVLILGQDPYPTPGHPMGLSFSTQSGVKPPRSLVNIYQELNDDLGILPRPDGDLTSWQRNGVMLLNRVLTVRPARRARIEGRDGKPSLPMRLRSSRSAVPHSLQSYGGETHRLRSSFSGIRRQLSLRTLLHCRRAADSSDHARLAGPTKRSSPRVLRLWTGHCKLSDHGNSNCTRRPTSFVLGSPGSGRTGTSPARDQPTQRVPCARC